MQYIHSKDIFMLIRDTLKLVDRRLMDHGSKVAYYVYKMLQCKGGYEEYELADIVFLVTFHDIGAYKTDNIDEMVKFETKEYHDHSLYGYLFLNNLTLTGEMTKVILYHHMDYNQLERLHFQYQEIASYINLAERIDIFSGSLGDKFNLAVFEKHLGTKISRDAYELFRDANERYGLFDKIKTKEYKKELEELIQYFILPNEDKEKLLELLMFLQAFKSEGAITHAVTTLAIIEKIGMLMGLDEEQQRALHFAGCVYDIGMLAGTEKVKQHVILSERLLQGRLKEEIVAIVAAHHERTDGSGYPHRLLEKQMNISQMILQFADAVSVLISPKLDHMEANNGKIIEIVKKQTEMGVFNRAVVRIFIENYNEIMNYVESRFKEIMDGYNKLNVQFEAERAKKEE